MASCAPVGNRRPLACFTRGSGGLATRRRLPTCPTTSAEFAFVGKVSGIGRNRLRHQCRKLQRQAASVTRQVWWGRRFRPMPLTLQLGGRFCSVLDFFV